MSTCDPRDVLPGMGTYGDVGLVAGLGITISSSNILDLNLPDNKDFKEIKSRIEDIEKRLAIVVPNTELQAKFPALQEAYEHYKLIEKLVNDQSKILK